MLNSRNVEQNFFSKNLLLLKAIVLRHCPKGWRVFIFGSTARRERQRNSDIDIGFLGKKKLSEDVIHKIRQDVEDSTIPYHVDLVDFFDKSGEFKKLASQHKVVWQ